MQIPCISCQSRFHLDSRLVKLTGSLVRCSKCEYIFRVFPPSVDQEPLLEDTKIDQSILEDLLEIEQTKRAKGTHNQNSDATKSYKLDEIASIHGFEEVEDPTLDSEDADYAELPDLSEYEKMINWSESADQENRSEHKHDISNSTQDNDK